MEAFPIKETSNCWTDSSVVVEFAICCISREGGHNNCWGCPEPQKGRIALSAERERVGTLLLPLEDPFGHRHVRATSGSAWGVPFGAVPSEAAKVADWVLLQFPFWKDFFKLNIYVHLHCSFTYLTTKLKMPKASIFKMSVLDTLALCMRDAEPVIAVWYPVHVSGMASVIRSLSFRLIGGGRKGKSAILYFLFFN